MTLTKPIKIGIIALLVLIAIVAIYFILKSGGVIGSPAGTAPGAPGSGSGAETPWTTIAGQTPEQTQSYCDLLASRGFPSPMCTRS